MRKTHKYSGLILSAFILFSLGAVSFAAENQIVVRDKADRRIVLVGDRIRYEIEVVYNDRTQIKIPDFTDGRIGNFEIKESGSRIRSGLFGKRMRNNWYSIACYDVGRAVIPAIEIKYKTKDAKDWSVAKTSALNIEVRSILLSDGVPKDIKDIKGPFTFFEINWWVVGAIIIFIAAFGVFIYRMTRRKAPVRLPHETALEELESARSIFLKGADVKEYYVVVSDCIRRYIERAFRLKAPEMTTEEFLNSLAETKMLSMEEKSLLREFLNACDLVKFAKYLPAKREADSVYNTAKKFIEETRPENVNV